REILRLKHLGRTHREIASSVLVSVGAVCGRLQRAEQLGLTWEQVQKLSDAELDELMYRDGGRNAAASRASIDYAHVHRELHRTGVTLQLLWAEYQEAV